MSNDGWCKMIQKKTVLVVGAGTSAPYGFPLGAKLTEEIAHGLKGENRDSRRQLRTLGFEDDLIVSFRNGLMDSRVFSVDAFLEHRPEFLEVGKAAIAQVLIPYEKPGPASKVPKTTTPNDDWIRLLLQKMDCSFDDLGHNKLTIVTYNYDRSLEFYLHTALAAKYGKGMDQIADQMAPIRMIHLHGALGKLPWGSESDPERQRAFDPECNPQTIRIAQEGIRIISENPDESAEPDFHLARGQINAASDVVFLGFGYHPTNMRRLGIERNGQRFYCSFYGMKKAEREEATARFPEGADICGGGENWLSTDFIRECVVFSTTP